MPSISQKLKFPVYILVLMLGAVWIWASSAPPGTTNAGEIPAPKEGFSAPEFSLETFNGEHISLSSLRGQPVLINIWASWCTPCRAEMPAMQRIFDAYQDRGFTILAVNATNQDSPENALDFASEHNLTFPILMDSSGAVSRAYQVRSLPTSFFVDREGIIQEIVIGGPMSEALLQTRVENLLQEAP